MSFGRIYAAPYNGTLTNAGGDSDLFSGQPADDKPIALRGMLLAQSSEIGDTQEEDLRINIQELPATFTVGSGGSAITAIRPPSDPSGAVWGATVRCNDTTVATTSGTATVFIELAWNERSTPFDMWFPDERFCLAVRQTSGLIVRMMSTPADDLTGCLTFWFEEN